MKTFALISFFLFLTFTSCNKKVQCPTGKAKKTQTYKVKKWKPYERGYRVARSNNENYQKSVLKNEEISQLEAKEIEQIPISIDIDSVRIAQKTTNTESIETASVKRDTLKRTIIVRQSPPQVDKTTAVNQPEKPDTIIRRSVTRIPASKEETPKEDAPFNPWNREPTVYEPPVEENKRDTLRRTTIIRHTDIGELDSKSVKKEEIELSGKPQISFDPLTQVIYKDKIYEKDEDFEFKEIIEFVPNYAILMYPDKADKQVDSLVQFLKDNPEKKIYIYGNGGRDDAEDLSEFELHNMWVGDPMGFSGRYIRVYYGKGKKVYDQVFTGLGNSDPYELKRIKEEGERKLTGYERIQLGEILYGRAKTLENFLAQRGIDKSRMISKRGEFLPKPNPTVTIKVLKD